jgi:hypothetical protein
MSIKLFRIRKDKVVSSIYIMAYITMFITLISFLTVVISHLALIQMKEPGLPIWIEMISVLIFFPLSIGLFFKSRFCAISLFVIISFLVLIFLLNLIINLKFRSIWLPVYLMLLPFYFKAVKATFIYHKYLKKQKK